MTAGSTVPTAVTALGREKDRVLLYVARRIAPDTMRCVEEVAREVRPDLFEDMPEPGDDAKAIAECLFTTHGFQEAGSEYARGDAPEPLACAFGRAIGVYFGDGELVNVKEVLIAAIAVIAGYLDAVEDPVERRRLRAQAISAIAEADQLDPGRVPP